MIFIKDVSDAYEIGTKQRGEAVPAAVFVAPKDAMPLKDFILEVMQILKNNPQVEEVLLKRVYPHRFAAENGCEKYDSFFKQHNRRFK